MADGSDGVAQYEAWLRQYVRLAETGRKLASGLADAARRGGSRMNEQRFSSHAQRLYNEEVYWTLQIAGVAQLAASQRAETPTPSAKPTPKAKTAKTAASRGSAKRKARSP